MPSDYFPLYHTLKQNIKVKRITQKQFSEISEKISTVQDKVKQNIILLIYEHARVTGDYKVDQPFELIYGIQKVDDEYLFDLKKMPKELFFILERLLTLVEEKDL